MRKLTVLACAAGLLALTVSFARADYVQEGKLLVFFDAGIKPKVLPREELVPVKVGFVGSFEQLDGSDVPALKTMTLQLARGGVVQSAGLARCSESRLGQRSTDAALSVCRDALVGEGFVTTAVRFPDGKRLRTKANLLLFNAGRRILMHIYTTEPVEGTFVIPLSIRSRRGSFGTVLTAQFPRLAAGYGYVTGFRMTLFRTYRAGGQRRSYLLANCPIPRSAGIDRLSFELARVEFRFAGGQRIFNSSLNECRVRG
ncbi:MAG TPA: hypothetical protein VHF50_01915 [Solirubrobacterales bacterium]|nr:hypothetical protein [Solirubrobacterales bacterium]